MNGTVFVSGDTWELDKYDSYGNLVESGRAIEDRRGRSPSAQVNGALKPLERFLSRRDLVSESAVPWSWLTTGQRLAESRDRPWTISGPLLR